MIALKASFKACLVIQPEITDAKTKETKPIGNFIVGKRYKVYAVADFNTGYTDFLVADPKTHQFMWLNMSVFRSE